MIVQLEYYEEGEEESKEREDDSETHYTATHCRIPSVANSLLCAG